MALSVSDPVLEVDVEESGSLVTVADTVISPIDVDIVDDDTPSTAGLASALPPPPPYPGPSHVAADTEWSSSLFRSPARSLRSCRFQASPPHLSAEHAPARHNPSSCAQVNRFSIKTQNAPGHILLMGYLCFAVCPISKQWEGPQLITKLFS